uniref:Arabinogalactan peptide 23-like n=1 Tax=Kalanchoe fedtschenkoi TaxID=63787 RepID=A0A7N0TPC4_KALFE
MDMRKVACAALVAAASMTAVLAVEAPAAAPGPSSDASVSVPAIGSLVGAAVASLFAFYRH